MPARPPFAGLPSCTCGAAPVQALACAPGRAVLCTGGGGEQRHGARMALSLLVLTFSDESGVPMSDFLGRDQAPLSDEQWKAFDDVVVSIARRTLVGRRMLNI